MVLAHEVGEALSHSMALNELDSIENMGAKDPCAFRGVEVVVRILSVLVFDEVLGGIHLSDVVVQTADTGE
jgi:hypothetical protein